VAAWSEQIRQCRRERGLTQEEFARELARVSWEQVHVQVGVDSAMVSKWERGEKLPSRRYQRLLRTLMDGSEPAATSPAGDVAELGLEYARSVPDALDAIDGLGDC
jgi:DNA-binding transcriptional regulator YiaG